MYLRSLAAGLIAVVQLGAATELKAADIYRPYDPSLAEEPGDDSRYGDVYRHPPPRYADPYPPYARPRYEAPYAEPRYAEPPTPWSRDWRSRGDYLEPMPYPPRFQDRYAGNGYEHGACLPRHEIRRALYSDGWSDFRELELRDDVAILAARRPNGQIYRLKVDRCTGQIVRARPLDEHADSFAWRRRAPYWSY